MCRIVLLVFSKALPHVHIHNMWLCLQPPVHLLHLTDFCSVSADTPWRVIRPRSSNIHAEIKSKESSAALAPELTWIMSYCELYKRLTSRRLWKTIPVGQINCSTFCEIHLFTVVPGVEGADRYHSPTISVRRTWSHSLQTLSLAIKTGGNGANS